MRIAKKCSEHFVYHSSSCYFIYLEGKWNTLYGKYYTGISRLKGC